MILRSRSLATLPTVEAGLGEGRFAWRETGKYLTKSPSLPSHLRIGYGGSRRTISLQRGSSKSKNVRFSVLVAAYKHRILPVTNSSCIGTGHPHMHPQPATAQAAGDSTHHDFLLFCRPCGARCIPAGVILIGPLSCSPRDLLKRRFTVVRNL